MELNIKTQVVQATRWFVTCATLVVVSLTALTSVTPVAAVPIPPPVVWHDVTCWEGPVEVTYLVVRADLPGTWTEGGVGGRVVRGEPLVHAWRLDLGDGTEVITTAPCRISRGVQ